MMANTSENLNKHLTLALLRLEELSACPIYSFEDQTLHLADRICELKLLASLVTSMEH